MLSAAQSPCRQGQSTFKYTDVFVRSPSLVLFRYKTSGFGGVGEGVTWTQYTVDN